MATAIAKDKKVKLVPQPASTGKHRINEHAMLVSLTVRRWHPHKTDRDVSKEVAETHQADPTMGKYRKRLLAKETFAKLSSIINEIRNFHYFRTLPWSEGSRILSSSAYLEYMAKMTEFRKAFDAEWQAFLPLYPTLKAEAQARMNSLYKEEDYPSIQDIATKFGVDINVSPIPSGNDFRVDLGDAEVKRIRQDIEKQAQVTVEQAMKEVWGRLHDVVSHAAERLKAYKDDGEKVEHPFRDTLVTNITELLDVIPSLNITNDPKLTKFAADIRKEITAFSAVVLRDDAKVRQSVAQKADDILAKMAGFLG